MTLLASIEGTDPRRGRALVWFLGGASFAVKFHGQPVVFLDLDYEAGSHPIQVKPMGHLPGEVLTRLTPLPFDPAGITSKAAYLSTHEHVDHCDRAAALAVANKGGVFIGPRSSCALARSWGVPDGQVRSLDGERFEMTKVGDVEVWAVPNTDPTAAATDAFVLRHDGLTVFHNGDGHYDGRKYIDIAGRFKVDVAMINLGSNLRGRRWYHTPCEVSQAANDLRPRYLLAHHYDKWDKVAEDPRKVSRALREAYPQVAEETKFRVLKVGQRLPVAVAR